MLIVDKGENTYRIPRIPLRSLRSTTESLVPKNPTPSKQLSLLCELT